MLKHAGMLEPQDPCLLPFDETIDLELRWKEWLRREHNNRYVDPLLPIRPKGCRAVKWICTNHRIMPIEADWL